MTNTTVMKQKTNAVCLGMDPGLANCGWAVIRRKKSGGFQHVASGVIHTESSACEAVRYATIYNAVNDVIHAHAPDMLSIERVYFNKNVSSCLSTSSVIGVLLLAAELAELPSIQVTPQQVKAATGLGGRASKAQVSKMISKVLGVDIQNGHATDAAAAAIAGLLQRAGGKCR